MTQSSGYKFPILNSNGSVSNTIADLADVFVPQDYWLDAGLWTWGSSYAGQLGNGIGDTLSRSSPVQIGSLSNWKQVSCAQGFTLAIKTDGTLWSWGVNTTGQLGLGDVIRRSSPIQIGLFADWKQIATSEDATLDAGISVAIKNNGTLWAWGNNNAGNLGDGTVVSKSSPVQIGVATNWKQVSTNLNCTHTVAVKTDGSLWSWGFNSSGQLGFGDTTSRSVPTQVGNLYDWKQVTNGQNYCMALKTDGTVWGWGTGFITGVSSPVQLGSSKDWKQIAAGLYHAHLIKNNGTLWGWGNNTTGDLGIGVADSTFYATPIQVGLLSNWKVASAGFNGTACIKTDGTLWTWGFNPDGKIGAGNLISYSSPIQLGLLTNWKQVSMGSFHCAAINSPDLP